MDASEDGGDLVVEQLIDTDEGGTHVGDDPGQEGEEGFEEGSDDQEGDKDEEDDSMETKPECGPRLFIGGLNNKTTEEDLRQHFEKYGNLKECFVVRDKLGSANLSKGRTKGFGFVTMSTVEDTEVLLKDTHVINDKVVPVIVSKPRDASEKLLLINLFHLDKEKTTKESLMEHFSQFGNVKRCNVNMEQVDGNIVSQGTGYVIMATEEELKAVMNRNVNGHQMIDGKSVLVKRTVTDKKYHDSFHRLWFGGLDQEKTTESDMQEHFSLFGTVEECIIARDPPIMEGGECRSKGYGFISMANTAETGNILKHPEEHRIHDKVLMFNRPFQRPFQPDVDDPPIKMITVSGLKNTSLTKDDLSHYFNRHGNVLFINMEKGHNNANVGLNKVEDAEKLAQMQDHYILKFWVTVEKADAKTVKMETATKKYNNARTNSWRGRIGKYESRNDGYRFDDGYHRPRHGPASHGPKGGWVFVENLYGQPEDRLQHTNQRHMKGYKSNHQQNSSLDPDGGYSGFGGGYNRNRHRGRGRPY